MVKSKLADFVAGAGAAGAVTEKLSRIVSIDELRCIPEIKNTFRITDNVLNPIVASMQEGGFDESQPIVVWKRDGVYVIVDGHTRYRAALLAGLREVPVAEKEFEEVDDAVLYNVRRQVERRQLSDGDILTAVSTMKGRSNYGAGRWVERMSALLEISPSSVHRAEVVKNEADEADLLAIRKGEKSISRVYSEINRKNKSARLSDTDSDSDDDGYIEVVNGDGGNARRLKRVDVARRIVERSKAWNGARKLLVAIEVLNKLLRGAALSSEVTNELRTVLKSVLEVCTSLNEAGAEREGGSATVIAEARRLLDGELIPA